MIVINVFVSLVKLLNLNNQHHLMQRGIALLSGGIDSPVAIHLMKERMDIVAAHFHQQPLTDEKEVEKVKELSKILGITKVYLIPFITVLKALTEKCTHKNYFILSKIAMFKAAELIAKKEKAMFLITGENLAQVSSQTLSNLTTITKNVSLEIVRPLLTYDKHEIITLAKKIGTYEVSSGPEICSLLGPKHPATTSNTKDIAQELHNINLLTLLQESVLHSECVILR